MTEDDDPFGYLDAQPMPRSSFAAVIRNLRGKYLHSIMAHDDDISVVLRFPFGITWRRFAGIDWCPGCQSMSPQSMIEMMQRLTFWDRASAIEEVDRLILSGDLNTIRAANSDPTPGTGYAYYNVSNCGEPLSVIVVTEHSRFGFVISHMHDAPPSVLHVLLSHLNRLAPMIQWSFDDSGEIQWCTVGTLIRGSEDDDASD